MYVRKHTCIDTIIAFACLVYVCTLYVIIIELCLATSQFIYICYHIGSMMRKCI